MLHVHDHNHGCEHRNLKYCGHCGVVYCKDCQREWGTGWYTYSYNNYPDYGSGIWQGGSLKGSETIGSETISVYNSQQVQNLQESHQHEA
jgi:hypothetical protein